MRRASRVGVSGVAERLQDRGRQLAAGAGPGSPAATTEKNTSVWPTRRIDELRVARVLDGAGPEAR